MFRGILLQVAAHDGVDGQNQSRDTIAAFVRYVSKFKGERIRLAQGVRCTVVLVIRIPAEGLVLADKGTIHMQCFLTEEYPPQRVGGAAITIDDDA